MKTTELKIGDLIAYNGKVAKVDGVDPPFFYLKIGYVRVKVRFYDNGLEPIPLTKDILEKNEWFLRRPKVYLLEHNSLTLKILVGEDFSSVWLKNLDAQVWLTDIKYVHQLQHILWALGIDDDLKV